VLDALPTALDDPAVASREFENRGLRHTVAEAIDRFGIGDVLVHTWDLARATGQDDTLDAAEVRRQLEAMRPAEGPMRASGHYGPRVEVPEGTTEQDRLIAFTGRTP
jgi:uncharacterized protein (TIGR03086 family)